MPDHEFFFEVDLSDEPQFDDMVRALVATILDHLGYPAGIASDTLALVHGELAKGAADGGRPCHIQFRAAAGELVLVVSYAGGHEWRTRQPLPLNEKNPEP